MQLLRGGASQVSEGSKAVMLWIHGGRFTTGAGSLYNATMLAQDEDVVVVTINYRLGMFGFLAIDSTGAAGMHGIGDQVLALKWIQASQSRILNQNTMYPTSGFELCVAIGSQHICLWYLWCRGPNQNTSRVQI